MKNAPQNQNAKKYIGMPINAKECQDMPRDAKECRKETKWSRLTIQDPEMQKPLQTQGPNEPPIVKTGYRRPTEL